MRPAEDGRSSSGIISIGSGLPISSAAVQPKTRSEAGFQIVTVRSAANAWVGTGDERTMAERISAEAPDDAPLEGERQDRDRGEGDHRQRRQARTEEDVGWTDEDRRGERGGRRDRGQDEDAGQGSAVQRWLDEADRDQRKDDRERCAAWAEQPDGDRLELEKTRRHEEGGRPPSTEGEKGRDQAWEDDDDDEVARARDQSGS